MKNGTRKFSMYLIEMYIIEMYLKKKKRPHRIVGEAACYELVYNFFLSWRLIRYPGWKSTKWIKANPNKYNLHYAKDKKKKI